MTDIKTPPKPNRNSTDAQHMSEAADTYDFWSREGGVWRSASGGMRVAEMTDDHLRRVMEQIEARAQHFAALYVWGLIYLIGADHATRLCNLFWSSADGPMEVIRTTELWKAMEARRDLF